MEWYFLENGQRVGPLTDEQFDEVVRQGKVLAGSFVWRQGMADWTTLSVYQAWQDAQSRAEQGGEGNLEVRYCGQCGKSFHIEDVITFRGLFVCAECKNLFFQRLREGSLNLPVGAAKTFQVAAGAIANIPPGRGAGSANAGFGGRLVAWMVDCMLILGAVLIVYGILSSIFGHRFENYMEKHYPISYLVMFIITSIIGHTLLSGLAGGSVGKLMLGYRIKRTDGQNINFGIALLRSIVRMISFGTLGYGFLMITWDKNAQGLHDKICDTIVARK